MKDDEIIVDLATIPNVEDSNKSRPYQRRQVEEQVPSLLSALHSINQGLRTYLFQGG
jgi:uncharacterized membrane protein